MAAGTEWLFIGCGSSYYLASVAAASWTFITGFRAHAIPASELLLFPELAFASGRSLVPIVISRSGKTTEAVKAAEYLEHTACLRTTAVTCSAEEPLAQTASAALILAPADEKSTVMTRSFSSMLLVLQLLAARVAKKEAFENSLHKLGHMAARLPGLMHRRTAEFVASRQFSDYVFLGQGPYFGLAREAMLKVTEMSASYAQAFNTLEFRHGPKAIASSQVLVTFLLSEAGYGSEVEVLNEIKRLGATTIVITNVADSRARNAADLLFELELELPEYARLAAFTPVGQLLGYNAAMKKGLNPDSPRHLSRVVVLDEEATERSQTHVPL